MDGWAPFRSRRAKESLMEEEKEKAGPWRFLLRSLIKIINESRLLATMAHQRESRRRLTTHRETFCEERNKATRESDRRIESAERVRLIFSKIKEEYRAKM